MASILAGVPAEGAEPAVRLSVRGGYFACWRKGSIRKRVPRLEVNDSQKERAPAQLEARSEARARPRRSPQTRVAER